MNDGQRNTTAEQQPTPEMPVEQLSRSLIFSLALIFSLSACTPFKDYTECSTDADCLGLYKCGETQLCEPVSRSSHLPSGLRILFGDISAYTPLKTPLLGLMLPESSDQRAHINEGVRRGVEYATELAITAGLSAPLIFEIPLSKDPEAVARHWQHLSRYGVLAVLTAGLRPAELKAIRAVSDPLSPALISLTQEVNLTPTSADNPYPELLILAPPAEQMIQFPALLLSELNIPKERAIAVYDTLDEGQRLIAESLNGVLSVPLSLGTTEELQMALSALSNATPIEGLIWLKNTPDVNLVDAVSRLKDSGRLTPAPLEVITLMYPLGQHAFLYGSGANRIFSLSGETPFINKVDVRIWSVGGFAFSALPTFEGASLNTLSWSAVELLDEPSKSALKHLFLSFWDAQLDPAATPLLARSVDTLSSLLLATESRPETPAALIKALRSLWSNERGDELVGPYLVSLSKARLLITSGEHETLRFSGIGGPIIMSAGGLTSYPYPHISCRLFSETAPLLLVSDFFTSRGADYALSPGFKERCGR